MNRSQRIALIVKTLVDRPGVLIPLAYFVEWLGAAKSSISEDLALVKATMEAQGLGQVRTQIGAAGGVAYYPFVSHEKEQATLAELAALLAAPERITGGALLNFTDLVSSPSWAYRLGEIFASRFAETKPDLVLTVELKGIPLALMTARAFSVPLVIARREGRMIEGPSVSINYVTGSSKRIQSMTVGRRAVSPGQRVLIIDDFMKAGGTARGLTELVQEFEAEVAGIGVLLATAEPAAKLVERYTSLLTLVGVDEVRREAVIQPT